MIASGAKSVRLLVAAGITLGLCFASAAFAKPPRNRSHSARPAPTRRAPVAPPVPGALPDNPTRNDLLLGIARIKPRVHACYDELRVPGVVRVKLVITSSGRVAGVVSDGELAGTPTAACVEEAVRAAVFRPFKRERITLTYPFVLKPGEDSGDMPIDEAPAGDEAAAIEP